MNKRKILKFRPYARLLTMLGDQLIKNERVALAEIVKNSYDADAEWVKVTFEGFSEGFELTPGSKIIIEDDGTGMDADIIQNHWVNPATPLKLQAKRQNRGVTSKGRKIQGEKGIGRFALLKLGRDITITTRPDGSPKEYVLELDVSGFDSDFTTSQGDALFLDGIEMHLSEVDPAKTILRQEIELGVRRIERKPTGTRIEIRELTGLWSEEKVASVYEDLARLRPSLPIESDSDPKPLDPFSVEIYRGTEYQPFSEGKQSRLLELLDNNTVFRIEGRFDEKLQAFEFSINDQLQRLSLKDPQLSGLRIFREYFGSQDRGLENRKTDCGPFEFAFYVFDFNPDAPGRARVDPKDKDLIRAHRIYLYRDGIRVYPYGDPHDDWLEIDIRRGTVRASEFLSNDQVVGFVYISQADNPKLLDKTSREGLIDAGIPSEDFLGLLKVFLAWVRAEPYTKKWLDLNKSKRDAQVFKNEGVQRALDDAIETAKNQAPKAVQEKLKEVAGLYKTERRYLVHRAETTEHLAGVGLSVEAASHDLMLAMGRATRMLDALIAQTARGGSIKVEALEKELSAVRGLLSFIEDQMKDMQLLFRSTKQRKREVRVREVFEKVQHLFGSMLKREQIQVSITETGSPLQAKTTDAVLLQLFLNLFDNAIYWLTGREAPRKIEVLLDGDHQTLVFADNGPGIRDEDRPYIFDPFYTGKGEDGRGLGLYIARQLLERQEYSIDLADHEERVLSGANFMVSFVKEGR